MFNNEALDVVIGIVLVYLLYSLLVTILGEIAATKLGLRPRMLRVAMERMLNDGYYDHLKTPKKQWRQNWLLKTFLYQPAGFAGSFAGRFYAYPPIRYLSRIETENARWFNYSKPSYFSGPYFAETLMAMLAEKSDGADDMQRIGYAIRYNTQHIQPKTLKVIQLHFDAAKGDKVAFNAKLIQWFNETMDRCNGWYKRKLQWVLFVLGLIIVSIFNVNSIQIASILSRDKAARQQLVDMGIRLAKDSARFYHSSDKDTVRSDAVLDTGFKQISKDIRAANLVLGLGWTGQAPLVRREERYTASTPEELSYYRGLSDLYANGRQLETELKKESRSLDACLAALSASRMSLQVAQGALQLRPGKAASDTLAKRIKDTLAAFVQVAGHKATVVRLSSASKENDKNLAAQVQQLIKGDIRKIDLVTQDKKQANNFVILTSVQDDWYCRLAFYIWRYINGLPGLLITALALSLGAPFWFDLLNKLISIRSAGVKPEEKKPDPNPVAATSEEAPAKAPGPGVPVNPLTGALNELTVKLSDYPGLVGLALTKAGEIRIMVQTQDAVTQLIQKLGLAWPLAGGQTVKLNIQTSSVNKLHYGPGSQISNEDHTSNRGTLGARLKKTGSDDAYILSCWHVMKENFLFNDPPMNKNIVCPDAEGENKVIASIVDGALTDKVDVGIAKLLSATTQTPAADPRFVIKKQHRSLTDYDSLVATKVALVGDTSHYVEAEVYDHQVNVSLPYEDGVNHLIYDTFSIVKQVENSTRAATEKGDSGAVIIELSTGVPLGMVIGGNGSYTYAIKFSNLLDLDQPYYGYSFTI